MVSIVSNTDADWSFGNGRAQFLTGELYSSTFLRELRASVVKRLFLS